MKKKITSLIASALFVFSISSYAAGPGTYTGINVGMANLNNAPKNLPAPSGELVTPKNNSIAGRLFVGGNISNYIALELGIAKWGTSTYQAASGDTGTIRPSSFDIQAVGLYPFGQSGFTLFGKFGFAALRATYSSKLVARGDSANFTGFYPMFGLGASYDITQRWVVDLTYSAIRSPSSNLRGPRMVALGISYHWAPIYCGQFLC